MDEEQKIKIDTLKKKREKTKNQIIRVGKMTQGVVVKFSKLKLNNQNIEFLALGSQFLEFLIGVVVEQLSGVVNETLFLENPQTKITSDVFIDEQRDTLGSLIIKLGFFIKDKELIKDLNSFRDKYRNRVTHHLFRKFDNIDLANEELSSIVKSGEIEALISRVISLGTDAYKDLDKSLNKNPELKSLLKLDLTNEDISDMNTIKESIGPK